jgi:hypothetical protein
MLPFVNYRQPMTTRKMGRIGGQRWLLVFRPSQTGQDGCFVPLNRYVRIQYSFQWFWRYEIVGERQASRPQRNFAQPDLHVPDGLHTSTF